MKKKILLAGMILSALQLTGCTGMQAKESRITVDNAKAVALEDAGFASRQVSFHDVELDEKNGREYYDIDFTVNGQRYEYDIDALTGEILGYEIEHQTESRC